jgi:hypothetical protein
MRSLLVHNVPAPCPNQQTKHNVDPNLFYFQVFPACDNNIIDPVTPLLCLKSADFENIEPRKILRAFLPLTKPRNTLTIPIQKILGVKEKVSTKNQNTSFGEI